MIARRGFMTLLGLAPLAAQAQITQGSVPIPSTVSGEAMVSESSALEQAARKYLQTIERREDRRGHFHFDNLPPHIRGKRSWSPAFKKHVQDAEYLQSISAAEIYMMNEAELVQYALKRGWGGLTQ